MADLADRLSALERQVAALHAYLLADKPQLDAVLDAIAPVVKDESFTLYSLYHHAAVLDSADLNRVLDATSARKLGRAFAKAAAIGYRIEQQGADANGAIWHLTSNSAHTT